MTDRADVSPGMVAPFGIEGLCCPRCRSDLKAHPNSIACNNAACMYATEGFLVVRGQPVLIDFETSIFDRSDFADTQGGSVILRDDAKTSLKMRVKQALMGRNEVAIRNGLIFAKLLKERASAGERPRILVVGGGAIGDGIADLYDDAGFEVVGTDVYVSAYTKLAADGHRLPFRDETFDGIWIQAVLEHVLEPWTVAAEIDRVLKLGGLVYADTPFMQQVHEGAYDFTRFTLSGHRWLFRNFAEVSSGPVSGAGTSLVWSVRYLIRALTGSDKLATAASWSVFWMRFLDRLAPPRLNADAASGVYFLGTKQAQPALGPKDMVRFYASQRDRSVIHAA